MRVLLVGLAATATSIAAVGVTTQGATAAPAAAAKAKPTSVSRTASNVPGYCSSPSGFVTNGKGTVRTLRLTVTPSSPRAGSKMTVKVFVKQKQSTPTGSSYPAKILQGQVVVKVGGKNHVLKGPTNPTEFTGAIFPKGWTAKATFKAPAKGKRGVSIQRIVYNARGAFNGGWSSAYAGFDLVCSGGQNPITMATPYAKPKLTIKVRKKA